MFTFTPFTILNLLFLISFAWSEAFTFTKKESRFDPDQVTS